MAPRIGIQGQIYFILARRSGLVKIGWSISPDLRIEALQTGSPEPLSIAHVMPGTGQLEKFLHRKYAAYRSHGEWYRLEGELAADLLDRRVFEEPEPRQARKVRSSEGPSPRLWQHRNGVYYVLFGNRLQRRVSAQTKDETAAAEFLTSFQPSHL